MHDIEFMRKTSNQFGSIAKAIENDMYHVHAWCNDLKCNHTSELDLNMLGKILGYDREFSARSINPTLRCTKCGKKNGSIRISPKITNYMWRGD